MYGRKKKDKPVKKMKGEECSTCGDTQHKVPKMVEAHKKVKPKEVFGSNYNNKKKNKKKNR
jgi:hypothetical protein